MVVARAGILVGDILDFRRDAAIHAMVEEIDQKTYHAAEENARQHIERIVDAQIEARPAVDQLPEDHGEGYHPAPDEEREEHG